MDAEPKRIPLFGKFGSDIVAWARVDEEDYADLLKYRWQLTNDGRVVRDHISGSLRLLARQILGIDIQDKASVTHIDGDMLNCQRNNLQVKK